MVMDFQILHDKLLKRHRCVKSTIIVHELKFINIVNLTNIAEKDNTPGYEIAQIS